MPGGLARFNVIPREEAISALMRCCGSRCWAEQVAAKRPFESIADLHREAESAWAAVRDEDRLEAYGHHPRIGATPDDRARAAGTAEWSAKEQSRMASASPAEREEFLRLNAEYERRFGFVFLICATGKKPPEMLAALRSRIQNSREEELRNAAQEQALITRLRIEKMLGE